MKELEQIKRIYMLGIGGIGMSALARYFSQKGIIVSGYDLTCTALTQQLEAEGMSIHYEENIDLIDKVADLVIYTPAIPTTHRELCFFQTHSYPLFKRSEVLGWISRNTKNIGVGGTHGKTTISTMIAYLLREVGQGGTAFLGGISANYQSNFWTITQDLLTIEADEFDRSFLRLNPDIAVISSVDADHLDIYGSEENIQNAYLQFSSQIKKDGTLFYKKGLAIEKDLAPQIAKKISYALEDVSATIYATNIHSAGGAYTFDVYVEGQKLGTFRLPMGGKHNVENATASIGVLHLAFGVPTDKIAHALENFKGIKRRFNLYHIHELCSLVDDYAHHPSEIRCLVQGMKDMFPSSHIAVIFQPHLYSRTRDFAEGFSSALSQVDEVLLLDIYPARELPIAGVSSEMLLERISIPHKKIIQKSEVAHWVSQLPKDRNTAIAIVGAGNIDTLVAPTVDLLKQHFNV